MRLIDADELINQGYEIVVDGLQYDTCNKSIDIDNIQTAYDIDKVVEELEIRGNEAHNTCLCEMHENGHTLDFENENGRIKGLKEAIEIVKQGSVRKDVSK